MSLTDFSRLTPTEKAMTLAFLPFLGATSRLLDALAAALSVVVVTLAVTVVARAVTERFGKTARWTVLLSASLGLAIILAEAIALVFPISASTLMYLYLVGVTPIVFVGTADPEAQTGLVQLLIRFLILIAGFGAVRELLGLGSIAGYAVPGLQGQGPVGILSSGAGALLLYASVLFIGYFRRNDTGEEAL